MLRLVFLGARSLWPRLRSLPHEAAVALGGATSEHPANPRRLGVALAIVVPVTCLTWMVPLGVGDLQGYKPPRKAEEPRDTYGDAPHEPGG